MRLLTSIVFLSAVINFSPPIYSQTVLTGTVQDPQGRAIDGAKLTLFRDHGDRWYEASTLNGLRHFAP